MICHSQEKVTILKNLEVLWFLEATVLNHTHCQCCVKLILDMIVLLANLIGWIEVFESLSGGFLHNIEGHAFRAWPSICRALSNYTRY